MTNKEAIEMSVLIKALEYSATSDGVVEGIRCEDCKYRGEHTGADFWFCKRNGIPIKVTDFCNYGERRKSE